MNFIITLLIFSLVIFLHELGHYSVARFFGVKVPQFSIGMGPELIGFEAFQTRWRISAFPIGGYVELTQDEFASPEHPTRPPKGDLTSLARWKQILVALAGPGANFLSVVIVMLGVGLFANTHDYSTEIRALSPANVWSSYGLEVGDRIQAVNDTPTPGLERVLSNILGSEAASTIKVDVLRQNAPVQIVVPVNGTTPEEKEHSLMQLAFDLLTSPTLLIGQVDPDSIADHLGIDPQDRIYSVNGKHADTLPRWSALLDAAKASGHMTLGIEKIDGSHYAVNTPIKAGTTLGIHFSQRFDPVEYRASLPMVLHDIGNQFSRFFKAYGTLFREVGTGDEKALDNMSGPIGIVKVGMDKPQSVTWAQYFIMLSVGLGVVNLIPIPVLDGGRVVILLVESALRRRLSERTLRYLLFPSAAFLLLLLVFLSIKDIINW